ncbi:LCP family protein [Haloactinomyces albus]|uniref:LCP family protein required for cell wall assembly n=1 Tax=Haloactinomyces albus TaxID=1352928 RepID=A0AAE3ZC59_9ACTN|nr:LCP family protein [Haloactinomyces albus]MDR7302223.1 LCP family protein required for cell wall assembly [Haloactinomyces albus]
MPQNPRQGNFGHRSSQPNDADQSAEDSSASGRRRRALGDDGTGGTRVFDLLSKHGKTSGQGSASHRRRQPEPSEDDQAPAQQPVEQPSQQPTPPQQSGAQQSPGHSPGVQQPTPQQPPAAQQPQAPQQPPTPQRPSRPQPAQQQPGQQPPGQQPPGQQPAQQPSATPPANGAHPPRSGPSVQAPHEQAAHQEPPPAAAQHAAPRNAWAPPVEGQVAPPPAPQSGNGAPPPPPEYRSAPRRPNGPPPGNRADQPASPRTPQPSPQDGSGPAPAVPSATVTTPGTPGTPGTPKPPGPAVSGNAAPEAPSGNGAEQTRITAALSGQHDTSGTAGSTSTKQSAAEEPPRWQQRPDPAAAPGTAAPTPQENDTEVTARQPPIPSGPPANAPSPGRPQVPGGRDDFAKPPGSVPPVGAVSAAINTPGNTAPHSSPPEGAVPPEGAANSAGRVPDSATTEDDPGGTGAESHRHDDERQERDRGVADGRDDDSKDGSEGDEHRPDTENPDPYTQAIDATLARFSAVHDQIAEEEAQRRKRFGWLLGKHKEPELGQDMPFDFVEGGRNGDSSRVEWKQQQRRKRTLRFGKALAVMAAVAVFVATGIGWSAKTWVDAQFREVSALDPNSNAIRNAQMQTGDLNFLLIGSDTRAGADASDMVGTVKEHPGARSDTTMVAHIPADRSRVLIVSFPRDLEIDRPKCRAWSPKAGEYSDQWAPAANNVKFNTAYAVGGPKCTTKVVQQISGLSITHFLGINFQGFQAMVNAVDGVRICSTMPIIDDVLGTVLPEAGRYKLNGQQALRYVRARHVQGDLTADYGRMERQQLFLSALLRKVTSADVLLDPGKLTSFISAVTANTFGDNIGTDQLIGLGRSLQGLDPNKVTFITLPTTGEANENGNEVLRESAADALFQAIIEGVPIAPSRQGSGADTSEDAPEQAAGTDPMAQQATANGGAMTVGPARSEPARMVPAQAEQPPEVAIKVFNTTDRAGLAGRTSEKLREVGYTVQGVGNIEQTAERTVIRHSAANTEAAQRLATSIPGATLVQDAAAGDVLRLELGTGFEGTVEEPDADTPEVPENLATVNAGKDVCG